MRRLTLVPRLLLLLSIVALAQPAAAEKVKSLPIVDKAIEYHGGSLYASSETSLSISSKSGTFRITSRVDGDRFEHTIVDTLQDGRERRTRMTNDVVERTEAGKKVTLDEEGAQQARDFVMSRVYFPFLPYRLNDASVFKEDLGLEEWGGRKLHKVKVTFEAGSSTDASDEYLYWFDPATGRVEQFAYSFGTGREQGGLRFRRLSNFRRVGNLLFSDAENLGIDGPGTLRVEQVTPDAVAREMKKISTVLLEDIRVQRLRPAVRQESSSLGRVDFPTTASPAAQEHFLRGLAALHSFWYDEAADAFRAAQEAQPGFALAYWGEALTYDHPIWGEQDQEAARQALQRLAATPAERAARAGNEKERAWLATVEALYGDGDKGARARAYAEALGRMHERWPDDLEVASFYALSLIGPALTSDGAALGEPRDRLLIRAAAILEEEVDRNPEHPGVLHYLIHAYDDPTHAPLGVRAARAYARVAPAAHHALHMPSHIFVQLGQWDQVAASNEDSWQASVEWTESRGLSIDKRDFHSLSWLAYAYLQQGRHGKVREVLEIARQAARVSDNPRVTSSLASMEARYLIERRAWEDAKLPAAMPAAGGGEEDKAHAAHPMGNGDWALTFTAGLAAGRRGDAAGAQEALARLRDMPAGAYGSVAKILEKEVGGLLHLARGEEEAGLRLLEEAADAEAALTPPSGPPDLLKPALELCGEVLLERGKAEAALKQFQRSLLRMPNRTASLLGAARAAAKLGRPEEARKYSLALAEIWKQADPGLSEVAEIRAAV